MLLPFLLTLTKIIGNRLTTKENEIYLKSLLDLIAKSYLRHLRWRDLHPIPNIINFIENDHEKLKERYGDSYETYFMREEELKMG